MIQINTDCRHYRGDIPCKPHKQFGVHCKNCTYFDPVQEKILIIKLGAIGDVIRTTPILTRLKKDYPHAEIHWLTLTPEIIPSCVDRTHHFELSSIETLKQMKFDFLFNLDKDREACALADRISAKKKMGFSLVKGHCHPMNTAAQHKWISGLFDDENRKNTKSYPQEIFEICGFQYQYEEYILDVNVHREWDLDRKKNIIGLNTGCGGRWKTRLWPDSYWVELVKRLKEGGYEVLLLGGEQEDEKNKSMAALASAKYFGHFELPIFVDLMNQCNLVVTAVTMALHIAIGLKKNVLLFNNIFNRHEFELFGRGIILEPPTDCKGCFMTECDKPCMELIKPNEVMHHIQCLLK